MVRLTLATLLSAGLLAALSPTLIAAPDAPRDEEAEPTKRVVELVICLDTSGSMDGLINAARQKLWSIVNDLALAEPTPTLRVALLTYGNDGHQSENGWVRVDTPFTEDLDKISQMLFALTTNGGTELVARVVQTATQELDWNPSTDSLKMIIVAGNESADQDQEVSFRDACKAAIAQGVMVNSIYCRYQGDGPDVENGWREVARLADGQYASINQDNAVVVIATPYDDALIDLSTELNTTYLPFGTEGRLGWENQQAQDVNALVLNKAAAASRAQTKGGALYACSWDLVDACRLLQVKLEDVKEEDLPENMKAMSLDERKAYLDEMQQNRKAIQKQIETVNGMRQTYVVAEQKRQAANGVDQFDLIIRSAVREQARAKGFEMPDPDLNVIAADGSLPYFVQIGTTWVAANLAGEFERAFAQGRPYSVAEEIDEHSDAYAALLESLDDEMRAALVSIEHGRAILKRGDDAVAVTMQPDAIEGDAEFTNHETFQIMQRQVDLINQVNQLQQNVQQRGQTAQTLNMPRGVLPAPQPPQQRQVSRQQLVQQEAQVDVALIRQIDQALAKAQRDGQDHQALIEKFYLKRGDTWIDRDLAGDFDAQGNPKEAVAFKPLTVGSKDYRLLIADLITIDAERARAALLIEGDAVLKVGDRRAFIIEAEQREG